MQWTPIALLDAWAARISGPLTNPHVLSTGDGPGQDYEQQAARYVEATPGFCAAHDVLHWRHALGRELADFPLQRPGETTVVALYRQGWAYLQGHNPYRVAGVVYREFVRQLTARLLIEPFVPMAPAKSQSGADVAQELGLGVAAHASLRKLAGAKQRTRAAGPDLRHVGAESASMRSRRGR